jgi:phosphate starvation-inducible PhoH-like protein
MGMPYFCLRKGTDSPLIETSISLEDADPSVVFGANNAYLNQLRAYFPKVKLVARGQDVKLSGDPTDVAQLEEKLHLILLHVQRFQVLTEAQVDRIVQETGPEVLQQMAAHDEVIVHGVNGILVKARTANQRKMVEALQENDMLFALGPAGTGKTYTAVALAVRALKNKEVRRIVLTRPAVEAGENLGFLPGDMKEKLDPYLQPLYDALRDMIPSERLAQYLENRTIEIAPLAFMRGRTLDNAFVILDEAQNTTPAQIKMFLTRMGRNARFIITGDPTQRDLPRQIPSGLPEALRIIDRIEGIARVDLNERDVVRHPLVRRIINAYDRLEQSRQNAGSANPSAPAGEPAPASESAPASAPATETPSSPEKP